MQQHDQGKDRAELAGLHAAVIADILDERGHRHQSLSPAIQPLDPSRRIFGRALTVLAEATSVVPEEPYRMEMEAVDALGGGDVLVATVTGPTECGFWGELLTAAALSHGGTGVILDGFTRDSQAIRELGFPLFARGCSPLDSKGRADVVAYGDPIDCGGVRVHTGDYVFGDADGVIVIPADEVDAVLAAASEKVGLEGEMRQALRGGMRVMDAYLQYGIL